MRTTEEIVRAFGVLLEEDESLGEVDVSGLAEIEALELRRGRLQLGSLRSPHHGLYLFIEWNAEMVESFDFRDSIGSTDLPRRYAALWGSTASDYLRTHLLPEAKDYRYGGCLVVGSKELVQLEEDTEAL